MEAVEKLSEKDLERFSKLIKTDFEKNDDKVSNNENYDDGYDEKRKKDTEDAEEGND